MWKKILVGLIVGFISGMFASGGGLLLIPAYIHFFDSSEKEARATAIFCILPMVLVTAIFYGTGNYINWKTGMLCSIGGIIGSFIGSKLLAILKGALEGRATQITEEMKLAAALAIANLIPESQLSDTNILPEAFDPQVTDVVAKAVMDHIR